MGLVVLLHLADVAVRVLLVPRRVPRVTLACGTIKGNNALTCYSQEDNHEVAVPHCIRCGKCLDVCPMRLMPLQMHRACQKEDLDALNKLNVMDCIECGSCAYNCPAGIHLVQSFRTAKKLLRDAKAKEADK